MIELRLDVGKFFFLWFFGRCGSALGESSYWEGLKRRLLFFVFGVLGTGIQVNLSVCFFPKAAWISGMINNSFIFFSDFFPPSFKAVLAQVGMDMNGMDRWSTTNRNSTFCNSKAAAATHDVSHDLRTQDLDAWRIGRTEVVGRQEQGLAGEKRPNDPPWKTRSWTWTLWSTKKKPEGWKNASSCKKFLNVFVFVIVAFV